LPIYIKVKEFSKINPKLPLILLAICGRRRRFWLALDGRQVRVEIGWKNARICGEHLPETRKI
jgi:hypothetical protein